LLGLLQDVVWRVGRNSVTEDTAGRLDQRFRTIDAFKRAVGSFTAALAEILINFRVQTAGQVFVHVVIAPGSDDRVILAARHVMIFLQRVIGRIMGKVPTGNAIVALFHQSASSHAFRGALGRVFRALAAVLVKVWEETTFELRKYVRVAPGSNNAVVLAVLNIASMKDIRDLDFITRRLG